MPTLAAKLMFSVGSPAGVSTFFRLSASRFSMASACSCARAISSADHSSSSPLPLRKTVALGMVFEVASEILCFMNSSCTAQERGASGSEQ